ncbi:cystatin-like protein isoform X2 [Scaptodrosophila lebanonensis]|nr:cystatin-like protein isoform X2 [Scaptodrosophila lebanonensis]XP_030376129.1 cystatin-like protein isoform X2 [Scaptodrosophila lebanonensis]
MSNAKGSFVGGQAELSGADLDKAIELLDASLAKLGEIDGPNYKSVKVHSATRQVVSGSLYRYNVELSDGNAVKQCVVKIWSQPWLSVNGTQITVQCEGDDDELTRTW